MSIFAVISSFISNKYRVDRKSAKIEIDKDWDIAAIWLDLYGTCTPDYSDKEKMSKVWEIYREEHKNG